MRILYGVPSEGMGHATRSQVILQHLIERGHDVQIATSDRAYALLESAFPGRCFRIEGLHLSYHSGSVDKSATFAKLMANAPEGLARNVKQYLRLRKEETPDVVISDFESFTYYFAKLQKLPLLSIDNMQVINRCELGIDIPDEEKESHRLAKGIIKAKVPFCQRYLVTTFFDVMPRKPNTELVPPILRSAVLEAAERGAAEASHFLVYQTVPTQKELLSVLMSLRKEQFVVYGLNREETHENVKLKEFSEAGFIHDLVRSRGVIANGGFSLISESVYLQRPVCSFPLAGQFEQYLNAAQIQRMGYGRCFRHFSTDAIKAFLYDLEDFSSRLSSYQQDGNRETLAAVDRFLEDVVRGKLPEESAEPAED